MGINAAWINPCFVSPFRDAGYDVDDYYRIAPRYGTNRDLYRLCREAHSRGIRVCLDLVAGHTSIDHPWFKASCLPERNKYSDRYIWAPSAVSAGASAPVSFIRGYSARDASYVANFFYFQPALNYGFAKPDQSWQHQVDAPGPLDTRKELVKIMTYWLGHGVDGFRVDMASSLVKMDPHRNRPTVEKQAGDPGSLLNHVRNLIALRKRSAALQAGGTLIPLPVEDNDRHFAYLRQAAGERFLIVLNPSAEPSLVRIDGIGPDVMSPEMCHGAQARVEGDDIQISLAGVSYGVFRL
ncbi:MAG: hypothetical protein A2147_07705 [Chloroflexi bacterium RBG_16_57_8]|nr:MAG: hypothetical protein A2147_07705 [Chloroflexi bacterium RBG_16_57_8]